MKGKFIKRILGLFFVLAVVFGLSACVNGVEKGSNIINIDDVLDTPNSSLVDFEIIENNFYETILVDKNTNVMYIWITADSSGITPIYNADGTLKLYEE